MTQNLWDTAKAVLKAKFTAIQAYLNKKNLNKQFNHTLKGTRKKEQTKPKNYWLERTYRTHNWKIGGPFDKSQ